MAAYYKLSCLSSENLQEYAGNAGQKKGWGVTVLKQKSAAS
jgi:hypothetical protein